MDIVLFVNGRMVDRAINVAEAQRKFRKMFPEVEFECVSASGYHYVGYVEGSVVGHFLNIGQAPDLEITEWMMAG